MILNRPPKPLPNLKLVRQTAFLSLMFSLVISACLSSPTVVLQEIAPSATLTKVVHSATPTPDLIKIWIDPDLPKPIQDSLHIPAGYIRSNADSSSIQFTMVEVAGPSEWIYALATPFFSTKDNLSAKTLRAIWSGQNTDYSVLIQENDFNLFRRFWGDSDHNQVRVLGTSPEAVDYLNRTDVLYLVPFHELSPEWKVLQIDGISPLDKAFISADYPLTIHFGFKSSNKIAENLFAQTDLPATNRETDKITVLIMTGTTALTRAIGYKMDQNGITYPADKIRDWLRTADITHISNEVSFTPTCPPADYDQRSMVFCSRPEYIGLLDDVGADVIELTGNHNLDWGTKPYLYSLDLYPEHNMKVYAGGKDIHDARTPLLLLDHGNKIAFLGCNYAGPSSAIATANSPGAAFCNYDFFQSKISELKDDGYLPIMTLQHNEYYHLKLSEKQIAQFRRMAQAGAIIVQGSQAHFPQPMEFQNGSFIHYGLGNLFFDQMDIPVKGTRREFIDRYVIYDGRLLSIELLTAMLEDYSQPRPMTFLERESFLQEIFTACDAIP